MSAVKREADIAEPLFGSGRKGRCPLCKLGEGAANEPQGPVERQVRLNSIRVAQSQQKAVRFAANSRIENSLTTIVVRDSKQIAGRLDDKTRCLDGVNHRLLFDAMKMVVIRSGVSGMINDSEHTTRFENEAHNR